MGDETPKTERDIINRFQELRSALNNIHDKINELEAELGEHDLVIKTLTPLDKDRKCFRLVGGILVERTVGEVLPAVNQHKAGIKQVVESLAQQAENKQKELLEFQTKYKIRVKGEGPDDDAKAAKANAQGVLVAQK